MKKIIGLTLAIAILLCLCACGSKYVCADCGDDFAHEASRKNTGGLCRDCYNNQPYSDKYCACGKPIDEALSKKYGSDLCSDCWGIVINAFSGY